MSASEGLAHLAEGDRGREGTFSSEAWLRLVVENPRYAILTVSPEGVITGWNRGAELITGYTREEILGSPTAILFSDEDRAFEVPRKELERARDEGHSEDDRWHRRKDGSLFWATGIVTTLVRDGRLVGFSKVFREGTAKKETEDRLRGANLDLTRFVYLASHDLQEPVRVMTSYLQLIQRRQRSGEASGDEKTEHYLESALETAKRMNELIQGFLQLCRAEAEVIPTCPTDLSVVFDAATANLRQLMLDTSARVTRCSLPVVRGNSVQLTQLFQNLVANAIKFRRENVPPVVYVEATHRDNYWLFSVIDNGIGVDPADRDRIFEMLQRGSGHDKYSGLGLGLAMCKRIVERHGGKIWVESAPGQGSSFRFTLPELPAAPPRPCPGSSEPVPSSS